jgi:uncharacterized protein (TIGR02246 family)
MSDTDRSAIARASARLLNAVNSSDVDAVLAVWAEDGVMMPPDKLPVSGRGAIEVHFRRLFSNARFRFQFTASEIEVVGDVASERVTYAAEAWVDGASAPRQDRGKGIHVYRRLSSGSWVLAVDIWNSDATGVT